MIDNINSIIEREIIKPTVVNNFNRQHIFYDLKDLIKVNSSSEDITDLYYCFSLYEKCLTLSRENSLNLAFYWLSKAEEIHTKISKEILPYLYILYKPTVAFYFFKKEEFDKAMELLNEEILSVDLTLTNNPSLSLEFKLEQLVNKYRVKYAQGRKTEALSYAKKIIRFILINENFEDIKNEDINLIKKNSVKSYGIWVNFIINNLIGKIVNDEDFSIDEKNEAYKYIFETIKLNEGSFEYMNYSLSAIQNNNNDDKFYQDVLLAFKNIHLIPKFIQYILISRLNNDTNLMIDLHKNYIINVLNLKI